MAVFRDWDELKRVVDADRAAGKRIVFTNGCFDLLHAGHVHLLIQARELGDVLVVAINSDDSVREVKGPDRPVVGEDDRAFILDALKPVDHVVIFTQADPIALLEFLRPDVLVKGDEYSVAEIVGSDLVLGYGGEVRPVSFRPNRSSSVLVEQIRQRGRERDTAAAGENQ